MSTIELTTADRARIVERIRDYVEQELEQELDQFGAEFLLDFFTKEVGPHYYNAGLSDAQGVLSKRLESITEAIGELEKPVT